MKRYLVLGMAMMAVLFLPSTTHATTATGDKTVTVTASTDVPDVMFAGAGTVDLGGKFGNDVLAVGGTVNVTGPVKGDVLIGGGTTTISGDVDGSVRVLGGTVSISGKVGRNVTIIGGTVTIEHNAVITGETVLIGGTLTANGHLMQSLSTWGGDVSIDGTIDGTVDVHTGQCQKNTACLTIGGDAVLGKGLSYWSSEVASIDSHAKITGDINKHLEEKIDTAAIGTRIQGAFQWFQIVVGLLLALALSLFFPKTLVAISQRMTSKFGSTLGIGALVVVVAPIAAFILLFTFFAAPISIIIMALYIVKMILAGVVLGFTVGAWITRHWIKQWASMEKKSAIVWTALLGTLLVNIVFALLDSLFHGTSIAALGTLISLAHFLLIVWAFGGLVVVGWQLARAKE